jgi:hypothetical protein
LAAVTFEAARIEAARVEAARIEAAGIRIQRGQEFPKNTPRFKAGYFSL